MSTPSTTTEEAQEIQLEPAEVTLLRDFDQAIRDLAQQKRGALLAMARRRGLEGSWTVQGDKIVKDAE